MEKATDMRLVMASTRLCGTPGWSGGCTAGGAGGGDGGAGCTAGAMPTMDTTVVPGGAWAMGTAGMPPGWAAVMDATREAALTLDVGRLAGAPGGLAELMEGGPAAVEEEEAAPMEGGPTAVMPLVVPLAVLVPPPAGALLRAPTDSSVAPAAAMVAAPPPARIAALNCARLAAPSGLGVEEPGSMTWPRLREGRVLGVLPSVTSWFRCCMAEAEVRSAAAIICADVMDDSPGCALVTYDCSAAAPGGLAPPGCPGPPETPGC